MTMRILPVVPLRRNSIYVVLVAALACDSLNGNDFIEPGNAITYAQKDFYILPASSAIIDLKSVIEKSLVSATLRIAEDPTKGRLTQMDAFVLKYTPNTNFLGGTDQFVLSAVLDDGTPIKSKPFAIHMKDNESEFPCGVYPVEDDIRVKPTSTAVIHVLKNDRVCSIDQQLNVRVHLAPKFGEAVVAGDSIVYTPGPLFIKQDEFVYSLSTSNGEEVSFGLVSINKSKFEILEVPQGHGRIFFTDDMTGFIAGGSTIQKTTDGGRHWIQLSYPISDDNYVTSFDDIFFLDKDHGFAAFSQCKWPAFEGCPGGWMMTKNGGESWTRIDLSNAVNSITFTSALTGYMSPSKLGDEVDGYSYRSVFKTVNGGDTWDEVGALYSYAHGKVKLRFATDNVGWAYDNYNIFSTTDGGITWKPFTNARVTSFALASDNVVCASLAPSGVSGTIPSSIVRSENGSPFQSMINFPYLIGSQGFSPEGELGIAVGSSLNNDCCFPSEELTISISTDKGKTWFDLAEHPFGYPLAISVPSSDVAYILCGRESNSVALIKYIP